MAWPEQLLLRLDFNINTNVAVELPTDASSPITALCLSPSTVWVGTAGAGLIAFDTSTGKSKRFTVDDGLMLNRICCLALAHDAVWIGYGTKKRFLGAATDDSPDGGLGRLDLATGKFSSFVPSIASRKSTIGEAADQPTQLAVQALAVDKDSDVWVGTFNQPLRCYRSRSGAWERSIYSGNCTSLAADQDRVFAGWYWNFEGSKKGLVGVSMLKKGGDWSSLPESTELAAGVVTALLPAGNELFVGGAGYIARFDMQQSKLLNFAYLSSTVDRLVIGGEYLWAQYNCALHRIALTKLP